jgi:hypothetical protein
LAQKGSTVVVQLFFSCLSSDFRFLFLHPHTTLYVDSPLFYVETPQPTRHKKNYVTMANALEITPNEGMPALPPLQRIAPVVNAPGEGDGQKWPLASTGIAVVAAVTQQPRQRIF